MTASDEERLLDLLEQLSKLRESIERKIDSLGFGNKGFYTTDFYSTLADYIALVDGEREIELFKKTVKAAGRSNGVLKARMEWIEAQLRKASEYVNEFVSRRNNVNVRGSSQ